MTPTLFALAAIFLAVPLWLALDRQRKRIDARIDALEANTVGSLNFLTGIVQNEADRNLDRAERLAKLAEAVGYLQNPEDPKAAKARQVQAALDLVNIAEDSAKTLLQGETDDGA